MDDAGAPGDRDSAPRGTFLLGDDTRFYPDQGLLVGGGPEIRLRPRTATVLAHLLAQPGRVITKDELIRSVWPGLVVTENSVAQCISEIRRALQDRGGVEIVALPRRGYLLRGAVRREEHLSFAPLAPSPASEPLSSPLPPTPASSPHVRRLFRWGAVAFAVAALVVAALLARGSGERAPSRPNVRLALAVLPLAAPEGGESRAIAEAFAEYLRSDLARAPATAVLSRGSTRDYLSGESDARMVGTELHVDFVLEGTLSERPGRLAIELQLVNARTGTIQWRDRVETARDELLESHSLLAARAAQAMKVDLLTAETAPPHLSGEAQALALRAWSHWYRNNPADNALARSLSERAIALDPESALGWRVQAASQLLDRIAVWSDDPEGAVDRAERAVRRAIAIDPRQPQVNSIFGAVMAIRGRYDEALAAFDAELALGRYHEPQVYNWIGITYLLTGEPAKAVEPFSMAAWLSPRDPRLSYFRRNLALAHLHAGDVRSALAVAREAVRTTPPSPRAYETLAAACVMAREDCAAAAVAELRRVAPGYGLQVVRKEVSSANLRYLAERARYLEALREAGL